MKFKLILLGLLVSTSVMATKECLHFKNPFLGTWNGVGINNKIEKCLINNVKQPQDKCDGFLIPNDSNISKIKGLKLIWSAWVPQIRLGLMYPEYGGFELDIDPRIDNRDVSDRYEVVGICDSFLDPVLGVRKLHMKLKFYHNPNDLRTPEERRSTYGDFDTLNIEYYALPNSDYARFYGVTRDKRSIDVTFFLDMKHIDREYLADLENLPIPPLPPIGPEDL
jgi:hypothetical protein